jgi:hypothetical protein
MQAMANIARAKAAGGFDLLAAAGLSAPGS